MRRSAQVYSGRGYYRKSNEIISVEAACGSAVSGLNQLSRLADGTRVGHDILKPIGVHPYPSNSQPVVKSGGFEYENGTVTDDNKRVFLTDITFPSLFDFMFDVAPDSSGIGGYTYTCGVRLYTNWPSLTSYWDTQFRNLSNNYYDEHSSQFVTNGSAGAETYDTIITNTQSTKKRLVRTAASTYNLYAYSGGGWVAHDSGGADKTSAFTGPVRVAFYCYYRDVSQPQKAIMSNFVINSGYAQIGMDY